jgi:hypothetical protein
MAPFVIVVGMISVLAWIISGFNGFKTAGEIKTNPVGPPADWNWQNFADAWTDADMGQGILNSGIIAVATAVGVAIIASLAAYSMTRLDLPAPGVWLLWLLVSISLPIQLFLVPLVAWWSKLGLYDSRFCLIIIYWAVYSPFATLLIRSFLLSDVWEPSPGAICRSIDDPADEPAGMWGRWSRPSMVRKGHSLFIPAPAKRRATLDAAWTSNYEKAGGSSRPGVLPKSRCVTRVAIDYL